MNNNIFIYLLLCASSLFGYSSTLEDIREDLIKTKKEVEAIINDSSSSNTLLKLQNYLASEPRHYLEWLSKDLDNKHSWIIDNYENRVRTMVFFNGQEVIKIDDTQNAYHDRAIISYSTYNRAYNLISRYYASLQKQKVKASYLLQWGGFPDIENGSLSYIHIPFSFKAAFFKEAVRKGYRYVLWIDPKYEILNNLEDIFQCIEKKGYFFPNWEHTPVAMVLNNVVKEYYELTDIDLKIMPHYHSTIMGFDMQNPKIRKVIDEWIAEAENSGPGYLSSRPEQNAIGIHLYKAGLLPTHGRFGSIRWTYLDFLPPMQ